MIYFKTVMVDVSLVSILDFKYVCYIFNVAFIGFNIFRYCTYKCSSVMMFRFNILQNVPAMKFGVFEPKIRLLSSWFGEKHLNFKELLTALENSVKCW